MQHVAELEQGILRPVESSEAGSRKVYPSQVEYTLQKNQEDGTLKRRKVRKVRGCLNGKNWDGDATGLYSTGAGRDVVMLQLAVGNAKGHRNLKLDIKNAYPEAKWPEGTEVYMRMFRGHVKYSADGTPMIYRVVHNYWGAPPAGAIFVNWLKAKLVEKIGFTELQSCNAAYRLDIEDRHVNLTTTTDDLLLTGETADLERVLAALKEEVTELKLEWDPTSFAGLELRQCKVRKSITVSVYTKVLEYAHLAGVTKAATANVTKEDWASVFLVPRGDELSATQQLTRRLTGMLAWFADLRLDVKPVAHKLQRVSHSPSEGAYAVHVKLAGLLLVDPHAGITFGGSPAANAQGLEITLSTPVGTEMKITGSATKDFSIVYDATWMDGHTNEHVGCGLPLQRRRLCDGHSHRPGGQPQLDARRGVRAVGRAVQGHLLPEHSHRVLGGAAAANAPVGRQLGRRRGHVQHAVAEQPAPRHAPHQVLAGAGAQRQVPQPQGAHGPQRGRLLRQMRHVHQGAQERAIPHEHGERGACQVRQRYASTRVPSHPSSQGGVGIRIP